MSDLKDIDTRFSRVACLLFAAEAPVSLAQLQESTDLPEDSVRQVLKTLAQQVSAWGLELVEVAGGWRIQVDAAHTPWVHRLYQQHRPLKLSRAQLETLAIIAHRQPVTRAEIEEIRGVSVGSGVLQALQGYGWIRIRGHKEVPGRPALWGTTEQLLQDLGLESVSQLQAQIEHFIQQVMHEQQEERL